MGYNTIFKRYELKYLLTARQCATILGEMSTHMRLDRYGRSTIRNIYYDTDSYLLVRRSIEKPIYKEKLRVRSYSLASGDETVFVELKKKYDSVVYKRRISLAHDDAVAWLAGRRECTEDTQIAREIEYFRSFYKTLAPKVFLSYEREAYYSLDGSDFRVTFDDHITARTSELSLGIEPHGQSLLDDGKVLMEIKCSGGIPLWMTRLLSREQIYKTAFSKYGTAYREMIAPRLNNGQNKEINEDGFKSVQGYF